MKDLAKENLRLSIENRQLKKKIAKLEWEYLELARFAQEREAVRGGAAQKWSWKRRTKSSNRLA